MSTFNIKYISFFLLCFFLLSGGCVSKPQPTETVGDVNDSLVALMDSIAAADTTRNEISEEEGPKLSFSSYEEAVEWMRKSPHSSQYLSGIIPDIAKVSLDYATRLINNKYSKFLIVDKSSMHVFLYDKYGVEISRYGIACSRNYGTKHKKGDNRTPDGFFSAEGIYDSTDWLYTNDEGYTSPVKGVYGPRFIRVDVPGTRSIGLHGTNAPWSIGHRTSHGCIRLKNEDIQKLVSQISVGIPIIISPSPKDLAVNKSEGYNIPAVPVIPGGKTAQPIDLPRENITMEQNEKSVIADSVRSEINPVINDEKNVEISPVESTLEIKENIESVEKTETPATPSY